MNPKIELTAEQASEVETLAALLSQEQIADYFGISRPTFIAILARDPRVEERYNRGKAKAIGGVAKSLIQAALEGDRAAQIFYLKTRAGWRETSAVEITGKDGGPVQTQDVPASQRLLERLSSIEARIAPPASE